MFLRLVSEATDHLKERPASSSEKVIDLSTLPKHRRATMLQNRHKSRDVQAVSDNARLTMRDRPSGRETPNCPAKSMTGKQTFPTVPP